MKLAVIGLGAVEPAVIPWWLIITFHLILYYSPDFKFLCISTGTLTLVKAVIEGLKRLPEIGSWEELEDILILPYDRFPQSEPYFTFKQKPRPCLAVELANGFYERVVRIMQSEMFTVAKPYFEGRETEENWHKRELHVVLVRKDLPTACPEIKDQWLLEIKSMLDGLLKTANSLRTTVSTNGCLLFQVIAEEYGPRIDNMVEILLQNFIKLCANTKPITRTNANDTVLAIISHVSYHPRIMQHIHRACQDKNAQPRKFACEWLKKVIKRHPSSTIEHHGGLDLIEKSILLGLGDKEKNVREAMRPTYWNFARRWPKKAEVMFSSLDKTKQEQLLADPSNPNPKVSASQTNSSASVSKDATSMSKTPAEDSEAQPLDRELDKTPPEDLEKGPVDAPTTTARPSKPSLKEIKAQMRKAQNSRENFNVAAGKAQSEAQVLKNDAGLSVPRPKPTLKEVKMASKKAQKAHNDSSISASNSQGEEAVSQRATQRSNADANLTREHTHNEVQVAKVGTLSAAPLRPKKAVIVEPPQAQGRDLEAGYQSLTENTEQPDNDSADASFTAATATNIKMAHNGLNDIAPPPISESESPSPVMTTEIFEDERAKLKRASHVAQAMKRLSTRSMDLEQFRILQARLKHEYDQPVWKTLIEPLCDWLETPVMPAHSTQTLDWEDEQYQALATLRLLLGNKLWSSDHYARICLTLTVANSWYKRHGPMVTGIRKGLAFLVNHCNVLECLHALCEVMEWEREESEDEIRLLSLGAMLHRIHSHPDRESEFYNLLGTEADLVNRLARIGSAAIHSEVASIRKAAISYAQEFWYLVPENEYYELVAGGDEKTQNLLKYYISRHRKIDDHVEL